MKASMWAPGVPGSAGRPSTSTGRNTMLPGMGKSWSGLSFMTRPQKSIHMGSRARAFLVRPERLALVVVADPDPGGEGGLVADEPGVGEVVRRPRLARDGPLERAGLHRRAPFLDALQQARHEIGGVGAHGVSCGGPRFLDHVAVAVRDARDVVRRHAQP